MSATQLDWLFATPLWQIDLRSDLADALPRIAAKISADHADGLISAEHNRSNFLGAQSARWLLRECPYFEASEKQLLIQSFASIAPLAPRFCITTWVNCGLAQAHNTAHVHPGAELSGVLYVQVPPGSGQIVFRDPRPQSEMARLGPKLGTAGAPLLPRYPVQPRAGLLLVFPSWLMHQVEPGRLSSGLRIAISFNINGLHEPDSAGH